MFFCAFFPTIAGNSVGNFRFFADFSAKKCFLPQKSPYNAVFSRKRLWKILLKFPAVLWIFSPKPIFSTQSRTKFPTIAGNFVGKSRGFSSTQCGRPIVTLLFAKVQAHGNFIADEFCHTFRSDVLHLPLARSPFPSRGGLVCARR